MKQVNESHLKGQKALSEAEKKEETNKQMMERIKIFCNISYQLYLNSINPDKPVYAEVQSKPPDEFTNAA